PVPVLPSSTLHASRRHDQPPHPYPAPSMGAGWGGGEIRDPLSRLQPQHFWIIQRPVVAQRRRGFTEGLHGELALLSDLHGQIAIDDRLADGMAEIGAGGNRDHLVAVEDRLAPEDGERVLEGEGAELALEIGRA